MKAIAYICGLLVIAYSLTGCAGDPPVPVQPVSIKAREFCATMKAVLPDSSGKPTWDIADTRRTIDDARKVGAAVDRNCGGAK